MVFGAATSDSSGEYKDTQDVRQQLIILVDEQNSELLQKNKKAVLMAFFDGLFNIKNIPMLVSRSVVWNYLYHFHPANRTKAYAFMHHTVNWDQWQIFEVEGTQFLFFLPKEHSGLGFNLASEHLIPFDGRRALYKKFINNKPYRTIWDHEYFRPEQLAGILNSHEDSYDSKLIWDIVILGHGKIGSLKDSRIAGLSAQTVQELLKYLNITLTVGTLLIESCGSGGRNSTLLQFDQAIGHQALLNLNFTVIVASVSDSYTMYSEQTAFKWIKFFELASAQAKPSALISLLASEKALDVDGSLNIAGIPQIWIPGGYGFQTFNVDKRIKILSKVLVAAHEDEGRPIIIPKDAQVVLIYPKEINVPIIVENPLTVFVSMLKGDSLPYHRFKEVVIQQKSEIGPFLRSFYERHQANNASLFIDELTCLEVPTFKRKIYSMANKSKEYIPYYADYSTKERRRPIHVALRKKLGMPILAKLSDHVPSADVRSGFSVQELNEFGLGLPSIDDRYDDITLDLSGRDIDDLTGLVEIEGIQNVNTLILSHNRINKIEPGAFQGLHHLRKLFLAYNDIDALAPEIFEGLNGLELVNLEGNPIANDVSEIMRLEQAVHRYAPKTDIHPHYSDDSESEHSSDEALADTGQWFF